MHGGALKQAASRRAVDSAICSPICRCRRARDARAALQHPRHRHRRHRRHHHRRAARHGRASRRQGLLGARLHRPGAEERRGDEPCPHRAAAGGHLQRSASPPAAPTSCSAATWSSRQVRPRCRRAERGATTAVINADLQPTASFVHQPRYRFRDRRDAARHSRRRRRRAPRHHRRHRHCHRADGRQHRHQRLHARLRLPEGTIPLSLEALCAPSSSTAPRRDEQAGLHLGTAGGRTTCRACAAARFRASSPNARPRRSTK